MPLLLTDDDEQVAPTGGNNYLYSRTKLDKLGASEYTIAQIIVDESSSVGGFEKQLENLIEASIDSCKLSPRNANIVLRVTAFNHNEREISGFKPVLNYNPGDFKDSIKPYGGTALFDATESALKAMTHYAEDLYTNGYVANGILFILTDGCNTSGTYREASAVAKHITHLRQSETLQSFSTLLIGINIDDTYVSDALKEFKKNGEIDNYVEAKNADPKTLAKIANIISQSVQSSSSQLAGQPATPVSLTV